MSQPDENGAGEGGSAAARVALHGSVDARGLVELLELLAETGTTGILKLTDDETTTALYFTRGELYFRPRHLPDFERLAEHLVRKGDLEPRVLRAARDSRRARGLSLAEALFEAGEAGHVREALRPWCEEAVLDLLLAEQIVFRLEEGLPPAAAQEIDQGRTVRLQIPGLALSAAARLERWRTLEAHIPTPRAIFQPDKGKAWLIDAMLEREGVHLDADTRRFDGLLPLGEVTRTWRQPRIRAWTTVGELLSHGLIQLLPAETVAARCEVCLKHGRKAQALRYFEAALELGRPLFDRGSLDDRITEAATARDGGSAPLAVQLPGARALRFALTFLQTQRAGTLTVRAGEKQRRLAVFDDQLQLDSEGGYQTPPVPSYLLQEGVLSARDLEAARKAAGRPSALRALLLERKLVTPDAWIGGLAARVLDEIVDLFFWEHARLTLGPEPPTPEPRPPGVRRVILSLVDGGFKEALSERLSAIGALIAGIPSARVILRQTVGAVEGDLLAMFDGRRTLREARQILACGPTRMLRFADQGLFEERLRWLGAGESRRRATECLEGRRFREARAVCASALDREQDPAWFEATLDQVEAQAQDHSTHAVLAGQGLPLPALLQHLHRQHQTGTLEVEGTARTELIYLVQGELNLFKWKDPGTGNGDGNRAARRTGAFDSGRLRQGMVEEREVDGGLLQAIKEELFELFLEEAPRFAFSRNQIPQDLLQPSRYVTRLRLRTEAFLIELLARLASRSGRLRPVL